MINIWDRYPNTRSTSNRTLAEHVCPSCPSKEFRMVYYYGFDRDNWDALTFKAWSADHAMERALELVPDGHRIKSVKPVDNQ